jgi:hypothetical protein
MGSLTQSSVIDVAVGMSFLFFVLAIFASATNEAVSAVLGIRSKSLRKWLDDGIPASAQANGGAAQANAVVDAFYSHPSVNGLTRDGKAPSYIPSEHAITALLDVGAARLAAAEGEAVAGWKIVAHTAENTHALIESLPDGPIKCALLSAWVRAGGDVSAFRAIAERWFDDAMDRLSGWYKRRVQVFMWSFGLVIALTLNADAIRIAETLWRDPTVRQLVDTQAAHVTTGTPSVATASGYLHQLPLPIGWGGPGTPFPPHLDWNLPLQIIGILITSAAVALGAPFWFDALSKLGSLRSTGPQPTPTNTATVTPSIAITPVPALATAAGGGSPPPAPPADGGS